MCRIMEEMRNESLKEGIQEEKRMAVFRMLSDGMLTLEKEELAGRSSGRKSGISQFDIIYYRYGFKLLLL